MALSERLELLISADPSQGISAMRDFATNADRSLGQVESRLSKFASAGLKIGAAGVGVGGLLTQMASGDIEAANQLEAAVEAAGQSLGDFSDRIDQAVESQVKFGHTDEEVNNSLSKLVAAYGDTGAALDQMQLVADLAAFKHISLADAAGMVAKAHGGAGRIFKEFNVTVKENADGTKDYDGALQEVSQRLSGQASAAADSWGGKLRELSARAENFVSQLGQDFGPAILGVSTGLTAVSGLMSVTAGSTNLLSTAKAQLTTTLFGTAAGFTAEAAAAETAAVATRSFTASLGPLAAGAAAGVAIYAIADAFGLLGGETQDLSAEIDNARQAFNSLLSDASKFTSSGLQQTLAELVRGNDDYGNSLHNLGITTGELGAALTTSEAKNSDFINDLRDAPGVIGDDAVAVQSLVRELDKSAESALIAAVNNGQLTQSSLDAEVAANRTAGGHVKWAEVLQDLANKGLIAQAAVDEFNRSAQADIDTKHQEALAKWYGAIAENADKALAAAEKFAPADIRVRRGALGIEEDKRAIAEAETELANLRKMGTPEMIADAERKLESARLDLESATLDQAEAERELATQAFAAAGVQLSQQQRTDIYLSSLGNLTAAYDGPVRDSLSTYIFLTTVATNKTKELAEAQRNGQQAFDTGLGSSGGVGNFGGFDMRASGGPVTAGHAYIVGERRPELFVPATNGYVHPSVPTANRSGDYNEITIVHPDAFGAADETARALNRRRILAGV